MTRFIQKNMMQKKYFNLFAMIFSLSVFSLNTPSTYAAENYQNLSLSNAIEIALKNNLEKQISYQSALIAESQYQQALSARWPTLTLQAGFQRRDKEPLFNVPATSITVSALGEAQVPVPEQKIKLMDQNVSSATLQFIYPLYTGGKITSMINQAGIGKEIAQEDIRRTSLQVVRDVKRYYYAAQLTRELDSTAKEIVGSLSSTRDFTKGLYEGGSESVNKLDFIKTELAVSYAKSAEVDFASKHKAALAALANTMGISWDSQINISSPLSSKINASPELETLIQQASQFNPQINILKLAVRASNEKIDEARSAYFPQVAFTADARHLDSNTDSALINGSTKDSWTIGIGISMPLFNGGMTTHQVSTAKLQSSQMQDKQKLVEQGVAASIKNLFIDYDTARQQIAISAEASKQAEENIDLTTRALQIGAAKPQDMIEASILAAMVKGNLLRAQHDQQLQLAEIDFILGTEAQ